LTQLVQPLGEEHDEHLFIIVHQVFELWFKQIIWEIYEVIELLAGSKKAKFGTMEERNNVILVIKYLDRIDKILRYAVGSFDILETMDGTDFLEFRDLLGDGSGFQSTQFRELELLLGQRERPMVYSKKTGSLVSLDEKYKEMQESPKYHFEILEETRKKMSLKEAVYEWLNEIDIPNLEQWIDHFLQIKVEMGSKVEGNDSAHQFFHGTEEDHPSVAKARKVSMFLMTYRHHPKWHIYSKTIQTILKIEQSFVLHKYRHPRMVEMIMIGRRVGTGGSSGVAYLDSTTLPQYRIFSDLIRIRGETIAPNKIDGNINEDGVWTLK